MYIYGAVLFALIMVSGIYVFTISPSRLNRQLDLGQKYLEEMDYEQAEVAFNKAIEIDPRSAEAYLGLIEGYIRTGEFDMGLEYAKKGYEMTGDERLKEKIEMIESGNITASNGWEMRSEYYDGGGKLTGYTIYLYCLQGLQYSVYYRADGSIEEKNEYQFDENGNCVRLDSYDENGILLSYVVNEYDENGNSFCGYVYDGNSNLMRYDIDEFNESGNLVRRNYYDENNNLTSYDTLEYDERGNCVRRNEYTKSGNLYRYSIYEYDESGNCIHANHFDENGKLTSYSMNK